MSQDYVYTQQKDIPLLKNLDFKLSPCFECCFFLGNFPASESYMSTFRNTPSVPTSWNRECSETSAYKIQTPGNYPQGSTQHTEDSFMSAKHFHYSRGIISQIFICSTVQCLNTIFLSQRSYFQCTGL